MADIVCPECGQITTLVAIRKSAEEFCPHCDYPLFWAPAAAPLVAGSVASDATLRRLPGTAGRQTIGMIVCPACGELNPIDGIWCIRCTAALHPMPAPEPEPEPLPPPEPEPEPEPLPEPRSWWWIVWALTGIVGAVGILLFLLSLD